MRSTKGVGGWEDAGRKLHLDGFVKQEDLSSFMENGSPLKARFKTYFLRDGGHPTEEAEKYLVVGEFHYASQTRIPCL